MITLPIEAILIPTSPLRSNFNTRCVNTREHFRFFAYTSALGALFCEFEALETCPIRGGFGWVFIYHRSSTMNHRRSMIDDRCSMIDYRWSTIDDRWSMIHDRWLTIDDRSMSDDQRSVIDDRWSMINEKTSSNFDLPWNSVSVEMNEWD